MLTTPLVSQSIAPEMVVIDDGYNGWRNIVLPLALQSEPVMKALIAASVFHFSANISNGIFGEAGKHYLEAILSLRKQHNLRQVNRSSLSHILISVLLLLVGVLVSGSADFARLFHMLEAILDSVGDVETLGDGELDVFLQRQIPK